MSPMEEETPPRPAGPAAAKAPDPSGPRRSAVPRPVTLPETEHRRYARILLAVLAAGFLFCAGQGVRWWQKARRTGAMERALHQVYVGALGGRPGTSPYGRLQFELGREEARSAQRLDMVELLAALSRRAPASVRIRSVAMAADGGTLTGTAGDPADFERYRAALATEGSFVFSVTRADTISRPVRFEITFKVRDRSAPPAGEDQ